MRYVKQRHANGCGAASLAMAAGISYTLAANLIHPKRKKGELFIGTGLEDALKALTDAHIAYRVRFDRKLRNVKNDAYISVDLPCGCRHAVAWDAQNQRVLDPDPADLDHNGKRVDVDPLTHYLTQKYVEKNLNYIVEIIPS